MKWADIAGIGVMRNACRFRLEALKERDNWRKYM
jgi:hypothetical protein